MTDLQQAAQADPSPRNLQALLVEKERQIRTLRGEVAAWEHLATVYRHRAALCVPVDVSPVATAAVPPRRPLVRRLLELLRRCRHALAPRGTFRDRLVVLVRRAWQVWRQEGISTVAARSLRKVARKGGRTVKGLARLLVRGLRVCWREGVGAFAYKAARKLWRLLRGKTPDPSGGTAGVAAPSSISRQGSQPLPAPTPADLQVLSEILERTPQAVDALDRPVDVLVPVYKGLTETLRCLRSLLAAAPKTPHEIIVLNDASPDLVLVSCLRTIANHGLITLLGNPVNLGFVQTVNRGLALHPDRDVVLLNSDTEVYGDWLDRLRQAAYSSAHIGSVTPLSNNATICSYPGFCQDNAIPADTSPLQLDQFCAAANAGDYVEVPTGVGFCMFVRRDCLHQVGLLDAEHFGKGYGEENDFCLRAQAHGWRHLLTADTFVYHRGAASFGAAKQPAVERALQVLDVLHPDYGARVAGHLLADPALPCRRRLDLARLQGPGSALLFVTHDLGGGTERHVLDMVARLEAEGTRALVLRPRGTDGVGLERPAVRATPNLVYALPEELWTLRQALTDLGVQLVHVNHTIGLPQEILDLVRDLELPYDWTIHDYYTICPRINLIDDTGMYCGEPTEAKCNVCIETSGACGGGRSDIARWRAQYGAWLTGARKVFVPHWDVAKRLARYFPKVTFTERRHLEQYGRARPVAAPLFPGEPLRVAVIGRIGPHKGSAILLGCAQDACTRQLPIRYVVVGHTDRDADFLALPNVSIAGEYREEEVFDRLESLRCHCAFFPSVWPETYCYTLSIALLGRLFPIVFDLGAPAARLREYGVGRTIALTKEVAAINDELLSIGVELTQPLPDVSDGFPNYAALLADYYGLTGLEDANRREAA
jgi:GT2 family glycosyltransferase/glycosyltransferase involved in cell wall biosynthesis